MSEPEHFQSLGHERAVHAFERHHVADGGERHEVEQAEQVRLRAVPIKPIAAKGARGGDQEQEHHARRGQMSLAREIVLPVGV